LQVLDQAESNDLEWGDGREVKLTYRPGGAWSVSAGVRFGKTNGSFHETAISYTDPVCMYSDPTACANLAQDPNFGQFAHVTRANNAMGDVFEREEYRIADFSVGRDAGFGGLVGSTVSLGLRAADLSSLTVAELKGVPDWDIPVGFIELGYFTPAISHTTFNGSAIENRDFKGFGPQLSWAASYPLVDVNGGRFGVDWSLGAGVLFGNQHVSFSDSGTSYSIVATPFQFIFPGQVVPPTPTITTLTPHAFTRSTDATVPNFEASLGIGYSVGGFTARAGYRWERYQNAIDGGFDTHKSEDRTIDGPYFKLSLGIGG
jgi:hypothetical protein